MNTKDEKTGKDDIMESFYKLIGEAHVENIIEDLKLQKDEINQVSIPDSFDEWFKTFNKEKQKKNNNDKRLFKMKKFSTRAASIAILVIVSLVITTLSVEAFRIRLFNLFLDTNEVYTEVEVAQHTVNQVIPDISLAEYYYLEYLPSGYYYDKYIQVGDGIMIYYSNGIDTIKFDQAANGSNYQLDTENAEITEVPIENNHGQLIMKKGLTMLFWFNEEKSFLLQGNFTATEAIKMAEKIKNKKDLE